MVQTRLPKAKNVRPRFMHIGVQEKILFLKHLDVMLQAGIPLREALEAIGEQTGSKTVRYVIITAVADLSDGLPLHVSLATFPHLFDPFFINIIGVGETSGTLTASLQYLALQLEQAQEIHGRVESALLYPAIVFLGAIGVAIYLAFVLLPQLLPLFSSLQVTLPPTTRFLVAAAGILQRFWLWFVVGIAILLVGLWALYHYFFRVRLFVHRAILSIPILGFLSRELQIAQCARILGTLLTSGVKVVPALRVTAHSMTNLIYQREFEEIATSVERGETIGHDIIKHPHLFSRTAVTMIAVGERTGSLPQSLLALAEFTEHEVKTMTGRLTTLIEPLVLIFVGVLVGFVALSIITPIYQLTQNIAQ